MEHASRRSRATLLVSAAAVACSLAVMGSPGCPARKARNVEKVTSFEAQGDSSVESPADGQDGEAAASDPAAQEGTPENVQAAGDGSGSIPPASGAKPWRITIGAAGDAIPHGRVKSTALNQSQYPDEPGDERYEGWWFLVKHLAPALQPTDLALFNLESPIATERQEPKTAPPVQNGPPAMAEAFEAAGFDVANLANNHMADQMREGISETVTAVEAAGLGHIGAGANQDEAKQALYIEAGGASVAFLAWTYAVNRPVLDSDKDKPWIMLWNEDWARKAVAEARAKADLVVVSMHWGSEFGIPIGGHQRKAAKLLCGAGADLVVGTGPHVLQAVERVKDPDTGRECLVAFSLGNLVSNQGLKYRWGWKPPDLVQAKNVPYARDSLLLRVTFAQGSESTSPLVESIEGVPLWTENNWILRYQMKDIQPDRIWIQPILPLLKMLDEDEHRKLLEERLGIIEQFIGDLVTYVEI